MTSVSTRLITSFRALAAPHRFAASMVAPVQCLVCARPLRRTPALCRRCTPEPIIAAGRCVQCLSLTTLESDRRCAICHALHPPWKRIIFLWDYDEFAKDLITTIKYRPSPRLCTIAAEILRRAAGTALQQETIDSIVPIPATMRSFLARGFNQCEVFAHVLKEIFPGARYEPRALAFRRTPLPQASLPYEKRPANMRDVFTCTSPPVAQKSVLLIDDVITTGATTTAAVQALLLAGAQTVTILALARSRRWAHFRA